MPQEDPTPPALQLRRTNTGRSSPSPGRREPTQDRISDILETALARAQSMPARHQSPRMQPLLSGPAARDDDDDDDDDDDEAAGVFGARSDPAAMNYQATADTHSSKATAATARSRRTAAGRAAQNSGGRQGRGGNGAGPGAGGDGTGGEKGSWKKVFAQFQSIELENKGSVARDHLALERTFLAWLRTSLTFASIGIAITQLFRLNTSLGEGGSQDTLRALGRPLGAVFLGISILVLFLGYRRYLQGQQWVIRGKFPASRGTVLIVSVVALLLMIVSLVVVIVVQPAGRGS